MKEGHPNSRYPNFFQITVKLCKSKPAAIDIGEYKIKITFSLNWFEEITLI
jgi:hypothetical protein